MKPNRQVEEEVVELEDMDSSSDPQSIIDFETGEPVLDGLPDSEVGDAQGKWRIDYGEILINIKDRLLGITRLRDPDNPDKINVFRESEPLLNKEGASRMLTWIYTHMHHGINFSDYTPHQLNLTLRYIRSDLRQLLYSNYYKWHLKHSNLSSIMDIMMDNIHAIYLRAKNGQELKYSYRASSSSTSYNVGGAPIRKQSEGFFSSLLKRDPPKQTQSEEPEESML